MDCSGSMSRMHCRVSNALQHAVARFTKGIACSEDDMPFKTSVGTAAPVMTHNGRKVKLAFPSFIA